jgi:hypothetical protein
MKLEDVLEEHLLEVETLRSHLIDDGSCSGGGESYRLGGGLQGDDGICRHELRGDALSGECVAQGLRLRRAHPHARLRPVGQLGE